MTPARAGSRSVVPNHRATGMAFAVLMVSILVATGCGVVNAAKKAVHDVEGNKATIDAFTGKVQAGESSTFQATYVTTGSAPATIVYAVHPPQGLAFTETPSTPAAGSGVDIIVNSSGEYFVLPACRGLGALLPEAGLRHGGHREPDLRLLHAGPLDHLPEGFLAGRRAGR